MYQWQLASYIHDRVFDSSNHSKTLQSLDIGLFFCQIFFTKVLYVMYVYDIMFTR